MRALVVVGLAGCYSIPPFAGALGDGDAGPIDAKPSTHDEDHDGIFDDMDRCPYLPAPQSDSDMDGIGDDCDLDPGVGGETRLFYALDTAPPLMTTGATTTLMPDTYDLVATSSVDVYLAPAPMFSSVRIDISFFVVAEPARPTTEFGLNAAAADYRNDGYGCFVTGGGGGAVLVARDFSGITRDSRMLGRPLLNLQGTLSMTRFAGGTFVCTLTAMTLPVQTVMFTPTGNEHGFASVKAADMNLRLDYIHIAGRP